VILIVDDEPINVRMAEISLAKLQVPLLAASNGREGLEKFEEYRPQLVILDVMMPEMDGYELCRQIKSRCKDNFVPVMMITALSDRESRLRGIEAGADDFLTKPFDTLELPLRVKNMLQTKNLYDQLQKNLAQIKQELAMARQIQQNLLPPHTAHFFNASLETVFEPFEEVSGDFIDFFSDHQSYSTFLLGDCMGHGVPAALMNTMFRSVVSSIDPALPPGDFLAKINKRLVEALRENLDGLYVTASIVKLDQKKGTLELSNAGHTPTGLWLSGELHFVSSNGIPLGAFADSTYPVDSFPLKDVEQVLLFSDGLYSLLGVQQNKQVPSAFWTHLLSSQTLAEVIADWKVVRNSPIADDLSMLRIRPGGQVDDLSQQKG